jgi:peroxiredoxin
MESGHTNKQGRKVSSRERWYIVFSVAVAVILITVVWVLTGRNNAALPSVSEVNRPAPDFTLPALDGDDVQLRDYRGQIVLINFWGSWCEPCRRETPALQAAYEQFHDQGLVVIGVNLFDDEQTQGNTRDDLQSFVEQYGVSYPIALDVEGQVARDYSIYPIPTSLFIDAQGNIRYMRFSELTTEEIAALFTKLKQQQDTAQSGKK